jgi:hypothetical protein
MALQTFTAGQVLTAAQMTSLQANDYNQTVSTKTASYTLVAADKGTRVVMNSASATTITVNTSLFSAGDTLVLQNISTGVCTVTAGTATVSSAGPLAIPQNGSGILYFTSAGVSIYYPSAVTAAASGLTLLNTTTFTSSSAVNVSNVILAATATNYFVAINCVGTINTTLNMRFRENVTDKATGYDVGSLNINFSTGTITQQGGTGLTTTRLGILDASAATKTTTVFMNMSLTNGGTTGTVTFNSVDVNNSVVNYGGCENFSCTAITGFSLIPASGNITGTVRTYSYANS